MSFLPALPPPISHSPVVKLTAIFPVRCDRLNSCSVPVSSDLFGDPCPGTHKYVELHYSCSPKTDPTRRPLPPWYLQQQPPLQSSHSQVMK